MQTNQYEIIILQYMKDKNERDVPQSTKLMQKATSLHRENSARMWFKEAPNEASKPSNTYRKQVIQYMVIWEDHISSSTY